MSEAIEWAGRVGAEWAKQADGLDGLLAPMGDVGLAALGDVAGKTVLDLGCGAGATTLALADLKAKPVGIDISKDLIARALDRADAIGSTAKFEIADATTYRAEQPFDALFSRFGAMFFEDPDAAYRNLRAQLKPDAPAVIVAWTDPRANLWASLPMRVGREVLNIDASAGPQAGGAGPFAWSDQDRFVPMLQSAGWRGVSATAFEQNVVMSAGDSDDPLERAVHFCMRIGPLARHLREIPKEDRVKLPDRLALALEPYVKEGAVRVPGKAWLIKMRA